MKVYLTDRTHPAPVTIGEGSGLPYLDFITVSCDLQPNFEPLSSQLATQPCSAVEDFWCVSAASCSWLQSSKNVRALLGGCDLVSAEAAFLFVRWM